MDDVSIIIVNWKGKSFLAECLDGIRIQTRRSFSIFLVDNASNDGSLELVQSIYPEVRTIALSENLGFAAANNIAIKSVNTEYAALLNNDAVPHPKWLENLSNALESHPEAGIAASKMLFYRNPKLIDRAGDVFTTSGTAFLRGRGKPAETYNEKEYVFGACAGAALYRTDMLRNIGLFDEDFFLLYEDVDLSFRAQLAGYKCIYVPEAVVYHVGGNSIGDDTPASVYYGHRNLEWVYIKNMPRRLILKTLFLHIIYDMGAFFFFARIGLSKDFMRAKRDALKDLRKTLKKRREIQRTRRTDNNYIWSLFEKEYFLPRLKRRAPGYGLEDNGKYQEGEQGLRH